MTDLWLVLVVTSAICGIAGYIYAKETGRDPLLWAMLGAVLNVLLVVFLAKRQNRVTRKS